MALPSDASKKARSPRGGMRDDELPSAPQPGDVIVRKEPAELGDCWTIGLHSEAAQIVCKTREAALGMARGYARQYRSRVWIDEGGVIALDASPPSDGRPRRKMARAR